jgi:ABC-type glycerol-3-phosphate transport system substrate-binding protein
MKRNRLFALLSLVVAVAMLVACAAPVAPAAPPADDAAAGGDAGAAPAAGGESAGKTTLTWLTLSGWDPDGKVQALFEEENPDIDLVLEQVGFNDLFQQIQIRLSSGSELPDVLSVDVPVTAGYGVRGWLAPLDDLFSEAEKADMLEAAVEAGSHEGKLISAPVSTSTQLLFINEDLFNAAGIPVPGPDDRLTYEQIAEMAPKLTQDTDGDGVTDVWGFTWEQTNRIYQLQAMPESLGGDAIGPDGLTVEGVINAQPWVDAFTYYGNAFNDGKFAPPSDTDANELFQAGKLAMMIAGPWRIRTYTEANDGAGPGFAWSVSRHPYFQNGEIVTPTGSWHVGINAKTANMDAARRFVHWLATSEGAEAWWRYGSGDFPAQKSVLELFQTDPQFEEGTWTYMKVAADEAGVNPVPRAKTPGFLEYEQILQTTFTDISQGADVQGALDTAAQRIQRELDKYR